MLEQKCYEQCEFADFTRAERESSTSMRHYPVTVGCGEKIGPEGSTYILMPNVVCSHCTKFKPRAKPAEVAGP